MYHHNCAITPPLYNHLTNVPSQLYHQPASPPAVISKTTLFHRPLWHQLCRSQISRTFSLLLCFLASNMKTVSFKRVKRLPTGEFFIPGSENWTKMWHLEMHGNVANFPGSGNVLRLGPSGAVQHLRYPPTPLPPNGRDCQERTGRYWLPPPPVSSHTQDRGEKNDRRKKLTNWAEFWPQWKACQRLQYQWVVINATKIFTN